MRVVIELDLDIDPITNTPLGQATKTAAALAGQAAARAVMALDQGHRFDVGKVLDEEGDPAARWRLEPREATFHVEHASHDRDHSPVMETNRPSARRAVVVRH